MTLDNLRAVLYGRVSAENPHGRSVDSQLDEGRRWAAREGVRIVGEYRDDGISASLFAKGKHRPGWQQVVDHIERRDVDLLWMWEQSRGSRERVASAALLTSCQEANVRIVLEDRVLDPRDPDDAYRLDTGAATAVLESGKISKRVKRAVDDRAARGAAHGWVTYGYRSEYDPTTGRLLGRVPDPETAPIVQEIVRRVLHGESGYTVCADLNRRGVPASRGGRWLGANMQRLICNPAYIARRIRKTADGKREDVGPAQWPPLISEAEHYQLLALFADPARRKYRQDTRVKHLGVGIFRCGREGCDGRMRVVSGRTRGRANSYTCRECFKVSRHQAPVDEFVETLMWRRLARPDVLDLLTAPDDTATQEAAAEVSRLSLKLADLRRRVDAEELSLDDLTYFRARWEPKLREAKERARPTSVPPVVFDVAGPDAEANWRALSIGDRRTLVAALLDVVILPAGRSKTFFDPADLRIKWRSQS